MTPSHRKKFAAAVVSVIITGSAVLATLTPAVSAISPVEQAPDSRPNIVLITTDDQAVEDLLHMRNVTSQVMEQGTTFNNSFAPFPLCCPDRATILTGQYAHNHGVLGNGGPAWPVGGYKYFDASSSVATWLQASGYQTAFVGKYLQNYGAAQPRGLVPPGWTDWHGAPNTGNYMVTTLYENGVTNQYRDIYQADLFAGISEDIIARHAPADAPFFLWASYFAPHAGKPVEADDPINVYGRSLPTPAVADRHRDDYINVPLTKDPSFNEQDVSDKPAHVRNLPTLTSLKQAMLTEQYQQRLESLQAVDEAVARTIDALAAAGELENTIIVFTSDNGHMHGEHRLQGKVLPYEPSLRVPLTIRGPGFPAGVERNQLVAAIDLAPTFVDVAQATPGLVMDGTSLLPIAADPTGGPSRDIVVEAGPKTVGGPMYYTGLRTPGYKYVEYATGEVELYDLLADPYELQSLHADAAYDAQQAELAARLALLRNCAGLACQQPTSE